MTIHLQTAKGISSLLSCTFSCSVADNGILNDSPDHRKLALPYDCRRIFIARGLRCLHRHSRHVSAKPLCPFDLRFVLSSDTLSFRPTVCPTLCTFVCLIDLSALARSFRPLLHPLVRRFLLPFDGFQFVNVLLWIRMFLLYSSRLSDLQWRLRLGVCIL